MCRVNTVPYNIKIGPDRSYSVFPVFSFFCACSNTAYELPVLEKSYKIMLSSGLLWLSTAGALRGNQKQR